MLSEDAIQRASEMVLPIPNPIYSWGTLEKL